MPLDLTSADCMTTSPALLDALRQADALSNDARTMPVGGMSLDIRTHRQLVRMATLLPPGTVTLPAPPGGSTMPPAYSRDEGDLRAIERALPAGWRIAYHPAPGGWEGHLHAPDGSACRFPARAMNTAGLRALLAAFAGLLLDHHPS